MTKYILNSGGVSSHLKLSAFGDTSLPIYALKEGEYVVIEH